MENSYSIKNTWVFLRLKTKQAFIARGSRTVACVLGSGSERGCIACPVFNVSPPLKTLSHALSRATFLPLEKQEGCPEAAMDQLSHQVRDNQSGGRK